MEILLERHDASDSIGINNSGLTAEHFGLIAYYLLLDHSVPLVLSRVRFSANSMFLTGLANHAVRQPEVKSAIACRSERTSMLPFRDSHTDFREFASINLVKINISFVLVLVQQIAPKITALAYYVKTCRRYLE